MGSYIEISKVGIGSYLTKDNLGMYYPNEKSTINTSDVVSKVLSLSFSVSPCPNKF